MQWKFVILNQTTIKFKIDNFIDLTNPSLKFRNRILTFVSIEFSCLFIGLNTVIILLKETVFWFKKSNYSSEQRICNDIFVILNQTRIKLEIDNFIDLTKPSLKFQNRILTFVSIKFNCLFI